MAGDWIKMRQDLSEDPAVVLISCRTDLTEDAVVGKLHKLWCWADKHTTDGRAPAITQSWVDRYVSQAGFSSAMVEAGWLSFSDDGIIFPGFEKHNGKSAKLRAENTTRQRLSRENRDKGMTGVTRTAIPKPFVRHVMQRDNYRCVYCGVQSSAENESHKKTAVLSVDHIIPESRGGSAAIDNLACCCRLCNNEKNDRTPEEWGLEPTFLQNGVIYLDGRMSHETRDKHVTREEKRREDIKTTFNQSGIVRENSPPVDNSVQIVQLVPDLSKPFPMHSEWVPDDEFSSQLRASGHSGKWVHYLDEFVLFWRSKPAETQNQWGWQNKFLKNILANEVRREANLV